MIRILVCAVALMALVQSENSTATGNVTCVDCPQYVALSAKDKAQVMLEKMRGSAYSKENFPNKWVASLPGRKELFKTYYNRTINQSFDRLSDEYMAEHSKVIHTHGTVAQVKFTANVHTLPVSGLFKGADYGFIRLSSVRDPFKGVMSPGIGLKLLRDGTYSGNLLAMYRLAKGQGKDFNFMKYQQKTWVPSVSGILANIVIGVFKAAATPANKLDTDEFSRDASGYPTDPERPYNVYFIPNADLQFSSDEHDFRQDFADLPVGTLLYDVVVGVDKNDRFGECLCPGKDGAEPCDDIYFAPGCSVVKLGSITTTSEFIVSDWGDSRIFFAHNRWDKKPRLMCKMSDEPLADTQEFRASGDPRVMCHAQDSSPKKDCPEENIVHQGCPFGYFYAGNTKIPMDHP